ncbi:hypothetical protein [Candidatus Protochlamydia phocaeensis]|uniref:hypothetical protein n=1 Tax=Candidatus Protochlamydia phocaeensis TaxID=1414722 RepID=UPI000837D940|nr:hypothetical protein [Candidatus Protochlamydia phocaeensis]
MIKKICLISFVGIFALAVFFQNSLRTSIFKWIIQSYLSQHFGSQLVYRDMYFKEGRLVIEYPRFDSSQAFLAKQIDIAYEVYFWERQLDLSLAIDQPSWKIGDMSEVTWAKWQDLLSPQETWFYVHPSIQIKNGMLNWASSPQFHPHALLLNANINSGSGGYLQAYLNGQSSNENYFLIQASSQPHAMELSLECRKVDCLPLAELIKIALPSLEPCQIASGQIDGHIKAVFPLDHRPYLDGELLIEDLNFVHSQIYLTGSVGEARLKLAKNAGFDPSSELSSTTVGELALLKPAALAYDHPSQTSWKINQIEGYARIDGLRKAKLDFQAQGSQHEYCSQLKLQGEAHLNAQRSLNLDVNLFCASPLYSEGKIHLLLHPIAENGKQIEVKLEKISYKDCNLLQAFFATYWPQAKLIELQRGMLDALIGLHLNDQEITDLHFRDVKVSDLEFKLPAFEATCSCSQASGQGKINLAEPDIWRSFTADLDLDNGYVQLESVNFKLPLTAIQTHLKVNQGTIPHALVAMELAGLKGVMDIEWGEHKELITLKLDGQVHDLAELFPSCMQEGLQAQFKDHRLGVLANVKQNGQQIDMVGTLHIQESSSKQADLIHFGCELKRISEGLANKLVPIGWFYAGNLPLEKFVSPFIFRQGILQMSGRGEFKGSFDHQMISVKYDVKNLKIENEDLLIEAPHLQSTVPGELIGWHQFDLSSYSHQGLLPIQKASYFEKNSGLHFNDIQGAILFKNKMLHIRSMEAYCQDVYFAGCLDLDYSDPAPGVFSVTIKSPTCFGKISHVQSLLSHLHSSSPLYKIPLDGDLNGRNKGLFLHFAFVPKDYQLQANFQGTISNGFLPAESADMALKGLYMDVDYHHDRECLEFTDIQGSLLIGKPRRVEEYTFGGHHITLQGIERQDLNIDIWIKDREDELMRLAAFTADREEGVKDIIFDLTTSHLSHMYPKALICRVKDWTALDALKGEFQIDLGGVIKDLRRFRRTGLLCLSHQMLEKLNQLENVEGILELALHYDPIEGSYSYALESSNIKAQSSFLHSFLAKGKKQDKRWIIDPLQWDQLTLFADLQQMPDKWKINFLGLNDGGALLLGLEGDLFPEEGYANAKVKLGEVNLSKLNEWEAFKESAEKWRPQGTLRLSGDMRVNCLPIAPWYCIQADLMAETQQVSCKDYAFNIKQPFRLQLQSDKKVRVENLELLLGDRLNPQAKLSMNQLNYDGNQSCLGCPSLAFTFFCPHLKELADAFQQHFPDLISESFKQLFTTVKTQGELIGTLAFETAPQKSSLNLSLNDGIYQFKNRSWDLKNCRFAIADEQLSFSALSSHERCSFQIQGTANWPDCDKGAYVLNDPFNPSSALSFPLTINWSDRSKEGFRIQAVKGLFGGINCDLNASSVSEESPNWSALEGSIEVDFNQIGPLLTPSLAQKIHDLKLGSLYTFSGHFWLNSNEDGSIWDALFFQGKLLSRDAILKGYQFAWLESDMNYSPKHVELQNLTIQDPAIYLTSAKMTAVEDERTQDWWLFIPQLSIKKFRPALLRKSEEDIPSSKFKTLLIKRLDFQNFSGNFAHLPSWQAQGSLHFQNASRKNIYHPLLAIPAEIILRLGLDPHVLNPVTGTIYFNLQGDRFYLTKFKDVYSEGRGSKFYLADSHTPSWMDMDGNLSIQIRMKQYNLFFKLAELFTVSVQGHLKNPKYALQKHVKMPRKEPQPSLVGDQDY